MYCMNKDRVKSMADRVFRDMAGSMTVGLAHVGVCTGLFETMAGRGPLSLAAVVAASGLTARYVEEWLKGMVAAGYLDYDPVGETFELPAEHAYLLASATTDHYMGGMFGMVPPLLTVAPRVIDAFRHGGGVPFADFGPACRKAIDLMNRGNYEHRFVDYWLAQLPDVVARLTRGGRALDVGCGTGHVARVLAAAFPASVVIGVDPDASSIAAARRATDGLPHPPQYVHATLDGIAPAPRCDLITLCDVLHDLPSPLPVLADIRARLADEGVLFVIEPRVSDRLEENVNPMAAMFYGFSVFHCMTQSIAHCGAGLGACMGPARTVALLHEAGFSRVDQIAVKSPTNLFYAARL